MAIAKFIVSGMSCASCSAKVEKAVSKVHGVKKVSVNLLTNSMTTEGKFSSEDVIKAVEKAGYGAVEFIEDNETGTASMQDELFKDKTTPQLVKRLVLSAVFLIILLFFTFGKKLFSLPETAVPVIQFVLCTVILYINRQFFKSGNKALFHFTPNMDSLVALGSGISYIYSIIILVLQYFIKIDVPDSTLYFGSSAMIVTLITIGKTLESYSKGKTTDAIRSLLNLKPETATVLKDGNEITVPVEQIKVDDIFIVKTGDKIPADGIILEGDASIDESMFTGEYIPVDKTAKAEVFQATINLSGYIKCKATRVGKDTSLSQIIKMVTEASSAKAPIAQTADKVSRFFVPAIILIALTTAAVWFCYDTNIAFALTRGIAVLVISCPCALGLATPVAIMVGNGAGAKKGILFKTAECLEETGKATIVILDKTGTITKGKPVVTDIIPLDGHTTEKELLQTAYNIENRSKHPLAKAISAKAVEAGLKPKRVNGFKETAGNGLFALENGDYLCAGNLIFIYAQTKLPSEILSTAEKISAEGKTPIFITKNKKCLGIIALSDELKDDSAEAVKQLTQMGMRIIMLTGDNKVTSQYTADKAGIKEVIAGVLPKGKEQAVMEIKHDGKTIMVGDGINDAPSLACSDIGMAIGAGTDVALNSADIILMNNSLMDVCAAIRLSRATVRVIKENLFWAFFYNVLLIPLAAGVFYKPFGITVSPVLSAAAMSLSSFCVVMNALRINLMNITSTRHDKTIKTLNTISGKTDASELKEKTIKIEGMKCEHCEASVKKALENIHGIKEASADHNTGEALIKYTKDIPEEKISRAIEEAGFKLIN